MIFKKKYFILEIVSFMLKYLKTRKVHRENILAMNSIAFCEILYRFPQEISARAF